MPSPRIHLHFQTINTGGSGVALSTHSHFTSSLPSSLSKQHFRIFAISNQPPAETSQKNHLSKLAIHWCKHCTMKRFGKTVSGAFKRVTRSSLKHPYPRSAPIAKFFPISKTNALRGRIAVFNKMPAKQSLKHGSGYKSTS